MLNFKHKIADIRIILPQEKYILYMMYEGTRNEETLDANDNRTGGRQLKSHSSQVFAVFQKILKRTQDHQEGYK